MIVLCAALLYVTVTFAVIITLAARAGNQPPNPVPTNERES